MCDKRQSDRLIWNHDSRELTSIECWRIQNSVDFPRRKRRTHSNWQTNDKRRWKRKEKMNMHDIDEPADRIQGIFVFRSVQINESTDWRNKNLLAFSLSTNRLDLNLFELINYCEYLSICLLLDRHRSSSFKSWIEPFHWFNVHDAPTIRRARSASRSRNEIYNSIKWI